MSKSPCLIIFSASWLSRGIVTESTIAQHFRPVKSELPDTAKEEDSAARNRSSRAAPFFGSLRPRILARSILNGGISRNVGWKQKPCCFGRKEGKRRGLHTRLSIAQSLPAESIWIGGSD